MIKLHLWKWLDARGFSISMSTSRATLKLSNLVIIPPTLRGAVPMMTYLPYVLYPASLKETLWLPSLSMSTMVAECLSSPPPRLIFLPVASTTLHALWSLWRVGGPSTSISITMLLWVLTLLEPTFPTWHPMIRFLLLNWNKKISTLKTWLWRTWTINLWLWTIVVYRFSFLLSEWLCYILRNIDWKHWTAVDIVNLHSCSDNDCSIVIKTVGLKFHYWKI